MLMLNGANRMITKEFLIIKLGLTDRQAESVLNSFEKELFYRNLLLDEGISAKLSDKVARLTDVSDICIDEEDLMRDKIRCEWREFIPKRGDIDA